MTLAKACQNRLFVDLVSTFEDEEYDGVVLDLSDQWCVLASIEKFDRDGYWIIRKDTIKKARHRRYEVFRHQILQADGILATLRPLEGINISTTQNLFASLVRYQSYLVIRRETKTEWWTNHSALVGIDGNQLLLHSFDGAGRFNKKFTRCKMEDVTSIRIGSHYLKTYQKAAPYNFAERQPIFQNP